MSHLIRIELLSEENGYSQLEHFESKLKSKDQFDRIYLKISSFFMCGRTTDLLTDTYIETIHLNVLIGDGKELFQFCQQLKPLTNSLRNLYLSNCSLNEDHCKGIGNFLKKWSQLESIDLSRNCQLGNGLENITVGLAKSVNTLKYVNFTYCNISEQGHQSIEELFKLCSKLETVHLGGNNFMKNGLENILCGLVPSSNTLKHLNFKAYHLNGEICKKIGNFLKGCSHIETINLAQNYHTENGLDYIFKGLIHSKESLNDVNIERCYLTEIDCKSLGMLLQHCFNIETINISYNNRIGCGLSDVCKALLQSANSLKSLNLEYCNIKEQQYDEIGNLLLLCSKIENINLAENCSISVGFSDIFKGFQCSVNTLKYINVQNCNLKEIECRELRNLLCTNSEIELIGISIT